MSAFHVLIDAWRNRDKLGESSKTRDLAAFLPAALEVQEAPANPIAKWLGRSLIVLFVLSVAWACFGKINIVASAEGKIIPSSRVKKIQPLEKAVVKKILVHEGQIVTQGQPLIELDKTLTAADEKKFIQERHSNELQLAVRQKLLQLLEGGDGRKARKQFAKVALKPPKGSTKQEERLYKQLLWQQWQQYRSQAQVLQNTLNKTRAEQAASKDVISKLQQIVPILEKRTNTMHSLYKKSFVPETDYLELEQQRIEQTQDLAAEKDHLRQLIAAEAEVKQQLHMLTAQTKADNLTKLTELRRQTATLNEEITKAADLNAKQILYAPVSGQVQQLAVNTVGGVVTEAQQLMLIVPNEEQLEVEVFLANKDIGFVNKGMDAEIKVHTFPFTKYGMIAAKITNVSDDATADKELGLVYSMQLLMNKNTILVDNREVKLIPGMAVTAEVKTGTRRIIEFFLAPLLKYSEESLRER